MLTQDTIDFRTETPIWTGDWRGRSDQRVLESGIIGSLRWWTELLVRGVGFSIPDPTEGRGVLECADPQAEPQKRTANPVEEIFGSTQGRRAFRLIVEEVKGEAKPLRVHPEGSLLKPNTIEIKTGTPKRLNSEKFREGHSYWFFNSDARAGHFRMRFITRQPGVAAKLKGVLRFIECAGALGAKTQLGLGIISLCEQVDCTPLLHWLESLQQETQPGDEGLPSLRNFFFGSVQCGEEFFRSRQGEDFLQSIEYDPEKAVEKTFWLKNYLRQKFKRNGVPGLENIRHDLFGVVNRRERKGSRICFSLPYGDPPVIRVFGWMPRTDLQHLSRITDEGIRIKYCADWAQGEGIVTHLSDVLAQGEAK